MTVELRDLSVDNFWEVIDLKVLEDQKDLVLDNAVSIAQSKAQEECINKLIYDKDGTLVGYLMYCIDRDDGEYWLYRLMIDGKYQGKGYGKAAMKLLIESIKKDSSRNKMFLGVDLNGKASVNLYKSLGFMFTDKVYGKEHIMRLDY